MSNSYRTTPLRVWTFALILTLPMPAPLFLPVTEAKKVGTQYLSEDYYRQELVDYLHTPRTERKRPMGVMLTMSGGSCATAGSLRLVPDGVEMYVIYYSSANLADFYGVADTLIQSDPDFVVIQDTVLVYSRSQVVHLYRQARQFWRKLFFDLSGIQDPHPVELARCYPTTMPLEAWPDSVRRSIAIIDPYSERQRKFVEKFLTQFTDIGIPIMITSPPHNEFSALYRSHVFGIASALVRQSPSLSGVSMHRQSEPTPTAQFNDPSHLSASESGAYRSWLNTEVERTLRIQND